MLDRKIDLDKVIEFQPWFIYKQLNFTATTPVLNFINTIEYGFSFLLNQVSCKYSSIGTAFPGDLPGKPLIEFVNVMRGREEQNIPIPSDLYTTPGPSGDILNLKAATLKNRLHINNFYQFRETINLKVTRSKVGELQNVDLLLCGYLIADTELSQWQQ